MPAAASPIRGLALKETYELQDVPRSPTRRPKHHHDEQPQLDAAETDSIDSHDSEDQDHLSRRHSRPFTPDEERAVVRKFDRHLVLFIALLYMLGFLDRSSTHNSRQPSSSADL